jgi:hypothetical protein
MTITGEGRGILSEGMTVMGEALAITGFAG